MFGILENTKESLKFDYSEPDIGTKIVAGYGSELMLACITGMSGIGQVKKLNEFCSHMAAAALKGDSFGVAVSCFSQHGKSYNQYLPVPIHSMSEEAFAIFVELLQNNIDYGFSKNAQQYLKSSRDDVEEKANDANPYALWLMGAWYAFDDSKMKDHKTCMQERLYWYEKSAFKGYLPAIKAIAGLYDNGDDTKNLSLPTDLKKSAFWYRHGALESDPICAYNLGVMYSQGDFVEKNRDVARMWLSLSYKNNDAPSFANNIQQFAKQFDIQLTNTPNLNQDPELNNETSEFQDAYEDNSNSNSGNNFWEWIQNNCSSVKFKPQEIEIWSDLKELELRSNDLSELSDDISIVTGLVDLSLFHNNFSIIPEVVFNLTELTWLNLGVNQIAELPHGIGRLKKLKILDLGQNQLISLSGEIGELKNLEQLIVHNNNLTSLPVNIGKMTALKHISLYENNLSSLPDEIINLSNLETIELQNNNFTDEDVKKWTDRFSNTKCKISFGYQQGNISDPIYVEKNIKGGSLEDSFSEIFLNSKDGDTVSNIFHWSGPDKDNPLSMMMAKNRYNKVSINEGLNAILSENNIVPINIELNAEEPSTKEELIQWTKVAYIQTCNENNLKPNSKLCMGIGTSGNEMTIRMHEF